ncbi:glycosyl hydrolase family 65 [Tritrichomonas foetus]|uniref:Glycosyl hydrolase family 65 n=1 Tax=Tritrichomonas foetus TaxID=1144522 RepID=A0A1J4L6M3_9EUKA|nr:glycosyl hydrolase family 65 [Tritrichomonas foetus]|eukprot:OHT17598.1 glycosyl hydrolase family 65 [Tritrichomonas foetus]
MQNSIVAALYKPCNPPRADDGWFLEATDQTDYVGAPVANGCIGILPWCEPFSIRHVITNHAFEFSKERDVYCVVKGINPFNLKMKIDGVEITNNNISNWKQTISMRDATHITSFSFQNKANVTYQIVALRGLPFAGLISVLVESLNGNKLAVEVSNYHDAPDDQYLTDTVHNEYHELTEGPEVVNVLQCSAKTKFSSLTVCSSSTYLRPKYSQLSYSEDVKAQILKFDVDSNQKVSFNLVGVICTTREYKDVFCESERQAAFAHVEGEENLLEKHRRLWNQLWEGDIEIEGDLALQRIVRFGLFNLYSFAREGSRLSISPMGLSSQGYNGHIFWDSELWMYPPLLLLNQPIAKSLMDYRIDRQAGARRRAYAHGYAGLMYPWESDDNGDESTPTWAFTGPLEHHVTADVSVALWNYYLVTKDKKWLVNEGYPVIKQIAEFWVSRVTKVTEGNEYYYSIERVVGADEYAIGVTDNAFTNGAVIKALEFAINASNVVGEEYPSEWEDIAKKLKIWKFDDGTTMEYKGYDGRMIKQADVNLIGYPLGIVKTYEDQKRDLEYYETRIDPENGPLMSYSAFVIQYARHLNADKATELFPKCYEPNLRPPFGVLSETPTSQNPYFATGAGGLLQAVINGFCGIEVYEDGIIQVPSVLPKGWTKLTVKGVGPERKTFVRNQ